MASMLGLTAFAVLPAQAEEQNNNLIVSALKALPSDGSKPWANIFAHHSKSPLQRTLNGLSFVEGESQIQAPTSPAEGITFQVARGKIAIGLPFAKKAKSMSQISDGLVAFDNGNGSFTVPLIQSDGSLSIASVIAKGSSAREFEYALKLPSGYNLRLDKTSGAIALVDSKSGWLASIAAPWAVDALGQDVPTHYEVIGNTVTQVVDTSTKDFTFPIVADPWFGASYIQKTVWSTNAWKWSPTLMVYPTDYGRNVASTLEYGFAWSETLSKTVKTGYPDPSSPSMEVQFQCHFIFVRYWEPTKSSWNLDTKLPATDLATEANYRCNYPVSNAIF